MVQDSIIRIIITKQKTKKIVHYDTLQFICFSYTSVNVIHITFVEPLSLQQRPKKV